MRRLGFAAANSGAVNPALSERVRGPYAPMSATVFCTRVVPRWSVVSPSGFAPRSTRGSPQTRIVGGPAVEREGSGKGRRRRDCPTPNER